MDKKSYSPSSIPFIQNFLRKCNMKVAYKYTCFSLKLLLKFTALHTAGIGQAVPESS